MYEKETDAKLRRFWADSKKMWQFFSNLYGQMARLWTNRGGCAIFCPKRCNIFVFCILFN